MHPSRTESLGEPPNPRDQLGEKAALQAKTTITGLAPGSTVQVRFRAVTKIGVADWSQPMSLFMK